MQKLCYCIAVETKKYRNFEEMERIFVNLAAWAP